MAQRRRKKQAWGGRRIGAGRPAMFEGPRVMMTVKVTERAAGLIAQTMAQLEPEHGALATQAAAVEYLVRKATKTPLKE